MKVCQGLAPTAATRKLSPGSRISPHPDAVCLFEKRSASTLRCTFPLAVRGSSATNQIRRGTLSRTQPVEQPAAELARRRVQAWLQHDRRDDVLAQPCVGHAKDRRLGHRRMVQQCLVDLDRDDLVPPRLINSLMRPVRKKKPSASR